MHIPLSEKLRPSSWDELVGHNSIIQSESQLRRQVQSGRPKSILLYGPPGTGKTSIAQLYLSSFSCPKVTLIPTQATSAELKQVLETSRREALFRPTLLWIDEIHRLLRPQQDLLLNGIETGLVVLIGATTENPSFELVPALLSRLQVITLKPLAKADLLNLLLKCEKSTGPLPLSGKGKELLIESVHGDARRMLNKIEQILDTPDFQEESLPTLLDFRSSAYGEGRYILISALHKSVRGSDVDASLYWLARLLEGGEDPIYVARRIIRMAIEDVGLADPNALNQALSAMKAFEVMGSPEGDLALAQAVVYLALSPKSASTYVGFKEARSLAKRTAQCPPPKEIINAPTAWMKSQGIGDGYVWDHDLDDAFSGQNYFPQEIERPSFYHPVERGFERELKKRLEYFTKLRQNKNSG